MARCGGAGKARAPHGGVRERSLTPREETRTLGPPPGPTYPADPPEPMALDPIFLMIMLISLVAWGGVGFALYLWIRKTLLQIRSEGEGSIHHRILDEVEQVRMEMAILGDRLHRMEERMRALAPPGEDSRPRSGTGDAPSIPGRGHEDPAEP